MRPVAGHAVGVSFRPNGPPTHHLMSERNYSRLLLPLHILWENGVMHLLLISRTANTLIPQNSLQFAFTMNDTGESPARP